MTVPVADSFIALYKGQNSYAKPLLLTSEEYARGINLTVRGGLVKTRPGFVAEAVEGMPTGRFQGVGCWSLSDGEHLVFVVDGVVYSLAVETNELTAIGLSLDPEAPQCWFCQVDRFLIIQDGVSTPVVLDPTADGLIYAGEQSIPIGTVMYFVFQRLQVADVTLGLRYFKSGDVLIPTQPESCLKFTEVEYWATGGAHCMPLELGYIYGMTAFRNAATGTGVGSLVVFADKGVVAYDFSVPRSEWAYVNTSQVLFTGAGCRSPRSTITVNDDLLYRGIDGQRTIRFTKSEVGSGGGSLSNTPMSLPVDTWFANEERVYLPFVSSSQWDNYIFTTAGGVDDYLFRGLVTLDTAVTHGLVGSSQPAFPGIWTGFKFAQVINADRAGRRELFAFTEGPELYRLDEDALDDAGISIKARLITRSHNFGDAASSKQFDYIDLWVSDVLKETTITVYFRPTGYPKWCLVGSRSVGVYPGYPGYKRKLRFSLDDSTVYANNVSGEPLRVGTEFQFAIEIEGNATIERCLMMAAKKSEPPPDPCDTIGTGSESLDGVDLDDWFYDATGGEG